MEFPSPPSLSSSSIFDGLLLPPLSCPSHSSYFTFDDFVLPPVPSPAPAFDNFVLPPVPSPAPAFDEFVLPPVPSPAPAFDEFVLPPVPSPVPAFNDFVLPPVPSYPPPINVPAAPSGLIPGMKFRPTDEEVVEYYLKPFVQGCSDPGGPIAHADVYDYEPQHLSGLAKDHGDGRMFFFTRIKKIGKSKTHRSIKSNTGFWRPTQSPTAIKGKSGNTIGYKTPLVYYGNKVKTKWLMQEYKLESHNSHNSSHELVVVVVYYRHTKAKGDNDNDNDD